jgi:hypothetical protein
LTTILEKLFELTYCMLHFEIELIHLIAYNWVFSLFFIMEKFIQSNS